MKTIVFVLILRFLETSAFLDELKCFYTECCHAPYIKHDFRKLDCDLKQHLYGQPLVKNNLVSAIKSHFLLNNPTKALVLSFHGGTGTGKNYAAQFIANSLYENGLSSEFVETFVASRDFTHSYLTDDYRILIRRRIESKLQVCKFSLFIFDEMDKIPVNLIDVIRIYVDVNPQFKRIDPRHSVFIFLSNTGAKVINVKALELMSQNISRNEFKLKMFRQPLEEHLYMNSSKGMWHSSLITNQLIDHYIPFLPLRVVDIIKCIKSEFKKHKIDDHEKLVGEVMDELVYEENDDRWFSKHGCKRIATLVRKLLIDKNIETRLEF